MNGRALLVLALLAGSSSGCATWMRPLMPARRVGVSSDPDGANVLLDGWIVGKTPCTVELPHTSDGVISVQLEGYEPYRVVLPKKGHFGLILDLIPLLFYPIILVAVHGHDGDASWRDDLGKAAAFSAGPTAGALIIDLGSGSSRVFPKHLPAIHATLRKRPP